MKDAAINIVAGLAGLIAGVALCFGVWAWAYADSEMRGRMAEPTVKAVCQ